MRIDIGGSPFVASDPLANKVIRNAVTLLLQIGFWDTRVGKHGLVVPVNVGGTITRYAHHLELVSKPPYIFEAMPHGDKLGSKGTGFDTSLFL